VLNGTAIRRIINGQNAIPNAFPWMASLRLLSITNSVSNHFCGGTLIFAQYVLTAAHCVQSIPANKLAVVLGIHSMTESLTDANKFSVDSVIAHADYDPVNILNDIAILRLSRPVPYFTNKIAPICLPPLDTSMDKKDGMAIGWGSVTGFKTKNSLATQLQQTRITVFESLADCNRSPSFNPTINFCAFNSINSNICFGDSGGPLIYYNGSKWLIHGVGSYIIGNSNLCEPKYPSYFTKVPSFLKWISDSINRFQ
jgi:secreted trypsin-like serine protease